MSARLAAWGLLVLGVCACRPAATAPPQGAPGPSPPAIASSTAAPRPDDPDASTQAPSAVRLVLWITVDQLRGDSFERFAHLLDPGGFELLLRTGAYYSNAHFAHALTETAPGHATLFTGASPAQHGIVGNTWLDQQTGARIAAVQDDEAPLLSPRSPVAPPAAGAPSAGPPWGRSPRNLLLPTIGDALIAATGGRSKVISISAKDRAAILPGGFGGKAFWLEPQGFLTSRYYYDELPTWVVRHAQEHPLEQFRGTEWGLLHAPERYERRALDDRASERPAFGLGRTFPHPLDGDDLELAGAIGATPLVDELTVSFALRALVAEGLGADDVPDLLAVSLSATDRVGHAYGPESLEAEDNFARLDRQLARLLAEVHERVGAERTLVVLSADHGGCETAEHGEALGLRSARITPEDLLDAARAFAGRELGDPDLVLGYANPSLWLDRARLQRRGLSPRVVAARLAEVIRARDDVYDAFTAEALLEGDLHASSELDDGALVPLSRRVRASLYPRRSGDVYVVPRPHSLLLQAAAIAATHGSPWTYDSHVPLLVAGPGVRPGVHVTPAGPHQLAATVALLLGIPAPAGASRHALTDLLDPGSSGP